MEKVLESRSAERVAAIAALASAPLAIACIVLGLAAVGFDSTALESPSPAMAVGPRSASLIYWSMIADLFGYYLLIAPAVALLRRRFASESPLAAEVYAFGGYAYVLVGAIGASALAAVWPPLIDAYGHARGAERGVIALAFDTMSNLVHGGLWNRLEVALAAVFWIGFGRLLVRENGALGGVTLVLGVACAADAFGSIAGLGPLSSLGLNVYLVLAPTWAAMLGVAVLRGRLECTAAEIRAPNAPARAVAVRRR